MLPLRRSDLVTRIVDDEVVILDRTTENVHHLNATASCIWQLCDGTRTVPEIAAAVAESFDGTPDNLLDEVVETIASLEQLGLVYSDDRGT